VLRAMQCMGTFRDLAVYRRSAGFGDALYRCTASWDSFARWTVGVQLVRSADSIGANIAESRGRRSDLDQRRFLIVARGSALELEHWIERAKQRGLLLPTTADIEVKEIGRMLNGLVRARA
jgi:four helix bundle protein